jgi:serine protease Do
MKPMRWYVLTMTCVLAAGLPFATARDFAPPATMPAGADLAARRSPIVRVFEECKDAVVNISATQTVQVRSPWDGLFDMPGRQFTATSLGSGFVIHPSGYIVTNAHVVAQSTQWRAIFADKREVPARIVALDQDHDLAVLKVDSPKPLSTLKLGRSDDLMVGETVIAIGNPLGYQNTCTAGIVSALERSITLRREGEGEGMTFNGLIQTDASINPGNSGGPLLNVLGELIGINTAIRGDAQNIGFAIPVNHLRDLLPEMLDVERRNRIVTGLKLGKDGELTIEAVAPGSPAAAAELRAGDRVLAVDGKPVASVIDFWIALLDHKGGDKVTLRVERETREGEFTLTLGVRPKPDAAKLLTQTLGIEAQELSPKMARAMGMEGVAGLLVDRVEDGGPAAEIGVKRGDVVIQLGRHAATSLDEVGDLLERVTHGQELSIGILRVHGNFVIRRLVPIQAR